MAWSPTLDTTHSLVSLDQVKDSLGIETGNEILDITVTADTAGSLGALYFLIASTLTEYYVWYDVADGSVDPAVSGKTGIEVNIISGETATTVATNTATAIAAITGFGATSSGNIVTVTNDTGGNVIPPELGTATGFSMSTQDAGVVVDEEHDKVLISLINDASYFFKDECHRVLKAQSLTEYYDGPGGQILYLYNPPVTGLTLTQDSGRTFAAASDISSTDYELDGTTRRILLTGDVFSTERHVIKAVYTGGYSTIPYDLQRAVVAMVTQNYELNDLHALSTKGRSNDKGGSTTYMHEMLPIVERAIKRYTKQGLY